VQVLNVGEDVAPTFNNCPKETVTVYATYAPDGSFLVNLPTSATDNATPASALQYTYTIKPFSTTRSSEWISKNTRFLSEKLPINKSSDKPHQIVWIVMDECGNMRECSYNLRITDRQKPNVACIGVSTQVGAELYADWLVVMGQDNSTPMSRLKFSFSPNINDKIRVLTCKDVPYTWLKIYVTDDEGNQSYCETRVRVSDGLKECVSNANFSSNETLENTETRGSELIFKGIELNNTPNPFRDQTTLSFHLPEAQTVNMRITDVTGSVVKVINGNYEKGYNEVKINDLNVVGILYCRFETANYSEVRKIIGY
jgi:Secretion system C-terminal sorting domain